MKRIFKDFSKYIKQYDGNAPRINFQSMYKTFSNFDFIPCENFGKYENFGQAFENKNLSMIVKCGNDECIMVYKEYYDVYENTAYVS